jgi:diguanylate cyclase (GGDEF)-like protein
MGFHEDRFILNLKSQFFDIFVEDDGLYQIEKIMEKMIFIIKTLIDVEEVTVFCRNECKEEVFFVTSTNPNYKLGLVPIDKTFIKYLESVESKAIYCQFKPIKDMNLVDLLIPLKLKENTINYILLKGKNESFLKLSEQDLTRLSAECCSFLQKVLQLEKMVFEERRYKQLFRVTEKVHSTMNTESVLGEIFFTLKEIYPTYTYTFLLSQDYKDYEGLPVKELQYDGENMAIMQSYVTGSVQFEDSVLEKKSILYAPLKGKQGVYGILQVTAPNTLVFPKNEVEFISLLANTAGGAIENAQLYEQSKQLISDLQLINDTSHRLNSNLPLYETMKYMTEQMVKTFGAEEVGFFLFSSHYEIATIQSGSTSFFFSEDAGSYVDYFKENILKDKDSIFIGDLKLPTMNHESNLYKSVMAVPMIQSEVLKGFVLVMNHEPYAFSFDTFKLFLSLVHHSTLAFTNTILREELEKMVVTDHLTKLYSRNYLDEKIQESMQEDAGGTFILIDIDNFKSVNDTYGHQVGDEVIIQVANMIKANIRGTDIGSRWGGEELAVYLPRVDVETGFQIAKRLVKKVRESSKPSITISCGISNWKKEESDSYHSLFKRADKALYLAKNTGKDKVVMQNFND